MFKFSTQRTLRAVTRVRKMLIVDSEHPLWLRPGIGAGLAAAIVGVDPRRIAEEVYEELRMKLVQFKQGSPEWLAWRRTGIGASESAAAVGANPYQTPHKLWKIKTGRLPEFGGNAHTERGHRLEPIARDIYERLMDCRMTPVCVIHDNYPWLKASLDGLSDTYDTVLEIKAPAATNHGEVLANRIPIYWQVQMQHQLLVTGASTVHFVSYNQDFPPAEQFALRVVHANPKFQAKLLPALQRFWAAVETGVQLEEWA